MGVDGAVDQHERARDLGVDRLARRRARPRASPRAASSSPSGCGRTAVSSVTGTVVGSPSGSASFGRAFRSRRRGGGGSVGDRDHEDALGVAGEVAAFAEADGPGDLELDEGEAVGDRPDPALLADVGARGAVRFAAALSSSGRHADSEGSVGTVGLSISPIRSIRRSHWSGFSIWTNCFVRSSTGAVERLEADVDVVVVVAHREGVARRCPSAR